MEDCRVVVPRALVCPCSDYVFPSRTGFGIHVKHCDEAGLELKKEFAEVGFFCQFNLVCRSQPPPSPTQ